MREPTGIGTNEVCFAEAIYTNVAEYPEELAFERGDVLRVLSKNPGIDGISEGWWLCVDRKGRKGVVPANRLQVMQRFADEDVAKGFFEVANPLFGDFFMFGHVESPFEDKFFRGPRLFPSSMRDRLDPLRRVNSLDEPLKNVGVVRNIPIRIVEQKTPEPPTSSFSTPLNDPPVARFFDDVGRRFSDFPASQPREIRRTVSSGRVSPPFMESTPPPAPVRKYVSTQQLPTTTASAITTTFGADSPTSHHQHVSSSEEDEQRRQPPPAQQRTLVLPSSVPGRTIEIPLGGSMTLNGMPSQQRARQSERSWSTSEQPDWKSSERSPTEHQTQMEKLTQRLRNLAGKPFRSLGSPTNAENGKTFEPKKFAEDEPRTPSPSSSGICADITDQSSNEEKRTSDISSLSGGSDQNSSLSDNNEDSRVPIGRIAHQPYMARLTPQVPSTSFPPNSFENERPTEFRQTPYRPEERLDGSKRDWSAAMPKTVEEDMRRNQETDWHHVPTKVIPDRPTTTFPRSVGDILEDELQSRKRVVCNKLTESLRTIDQAMSLISKCTAAQHWRVPHILQGNLPSLREAVAAIDDSLENFIDTTGRISIDRSNIKYVELNRLLAPVSEYRPMVASLRKTLDSAGWTVAVLSRDRDEMRVSPDNLEHFISIAKHVPTDCRRIVQWTQMLVPSNSVLFLSPSSTSRLPHTSSPFLTTPTKSLLDRSFDRVQRTATTPTYEDKRLSTSSTSTIGAGTDASQPSSILVTQQNRAEKPQRGRVTFADEQTDRSSTGSSIENSSLEYSPIRKTPQPVVQTPILSQVVPESRIIEEDDLESVVSDRESLFQDYAYLDDVVPGRSNNSAKFIPEEDKQVIEFYLPQLDQHTDSLTNAVEEFLQTVEMNLPPREFVQKGKMIILAAHKLIYIGDSVSQCLHDVNCAERLRQAADRLCEYLKECVQATKVAADEHPDIGCMQAMVDSVMRVSTAAHDLKSGMRNMI